MGPVNTMLSEAGQSQKVSTIWFHSNEASRVVRFIETENRKVCAREQGEGEWGIYQ